MPGLQSLRQDEALFVHLAHHAGEPWNLQLQTFMNAAHQSSRQICEILAIKAPSLLERMDPQLFIQDSSLCTVRHFQNLPRACFSDRGFVVKLCQRLVETSQESYYVSGTYMTLLKLCPSEMLQDFSFARSLVSIRVEMIELLPMNRFSEEEQRQLVLLSLSPFKKSFSSLASLSYLGSHSSLSFTSFPVFDLPLKKAALLAWTQVVSRLPLGCIQKMTRRQIALFHAEEALYSDDAFWLEVLNHALAYGFVRASKSAEPIRGGLLLHPEIRELLQEKLTDKIAFRRFEVALLQAQMDLKEVLAHLLLCREVSDNLAEVQKATTELLLWALTV
jgi:hypothetical protein